MGFFPGLGASPEAPQFSCNKFCPFRGYTRVIPA